MEFETKHDRRILLENRMDGRLMLCAERVGGNRETIAAVLSPEEAYKIHDWIAENIERPSQPKNAREIIDRLPVGSTFTLREPDSDSDLRYFRKEDEETVREYEDEYMISTIPWDKFPLVGEDWSKNLFTSWSVESYSEFEPVEEPLTLQHWEQMPVGAVFGFGSGPHGPRENWYFPYTKLDQRSYGHSPEDARSIYTDTTHGDRARGLFWRVGDGYTYGPEESE